MVAAPIHESPNQGSSVNVVSKVTFLFIGEKSRLQEIHAKVRVRERNKSKRISLGTSVARNFLAFKDGKDVIESALQEHMQLSHMDVRLFHLQYPFRWSTTEC